MSYLWAGIACNRPVRNRFAVQPTTTATTATTTTTVEEGAHHTMSEQSTTPSGIKALIESTNAADSDAFVAAFTDDAYVRDGSREFTGHAGVADWDRTDNIGVGMHFDLLGVEALGGDVYTVSIKATSKRFSGTGDLRITLHDGLISRLEIG